MASSLADTLEQLGYRIEQQQNSFDILIEFRVRVRVTEARDRLKLEPRFGYVSRSTAGWMMGIAVAFYVLNMVFAGHEPTPRAVL